MDMERWWVGVVLLNDQQTGGEVGRPLCAPERPAIARSLLGEAIPGIEAGGGSVDRRGTRIAGYRANGRKQQQPAAAGGWAVDGARSLLGPSIPHRVGAFGAGKGAPTIDVGAGGVFRSSVTRCSARIGCGPLRRSLHVR